MKDSKISESPQKSSNIQPCITFMDFNRSSRVRAFWKAKKNFFGVIKWAYNKTFVKIMKNTVHFRNFENSRLNKSDVKIGEDERFLIGTTIF